MKAPAERAGIIPEMYTADGMEYSYDISVTDGTILEKDADRD